jgi:LacI family transcriptional regulator
LYLETEVARIKSSKKSGRPSMYDVAERAGVSQTTVSFVVNQVSTANIPQETQDRVWAAIEELGYRPNALARGLSSQRTNTIGIISDEIATTPHAGRIIEGAQELAWKHKILLMLINTGRHQEMKRAAVEMMLERRVDGIIYATMYHRPVSPPESLQEVPVVLLDCYAEDRSLPSVVPDEVLGGYTATKHLLEKGHRRIGIINNVDPIPATFGRLEGYKQALAELDLPYDEDLLRTGMSDANGGYDCTLELMQSSNPPTALFCFNDHMAMGAYDALRKLNLSIPGDVAVIGFDNQELIAANLHPGLTTMQLPHYEMGQWAVSTLLDQVENPDGHQEVPVQHTIRCSLVERSST